MRIFNTIGIETGARCSRKCWFCPVAHNTRPNEFMSMELINSITHQLSELKYKGRVVLYIYNEPLLDSRLLPIIRQVRNAVPNSCIMAATNTDLIKNSKQIKGLFEAGLNQLQLNIYSNMTRFREVQAMLKEVPDIVEGNIYENVGHRKRVYSLEQKFDKKITPNSPKVGKFELNNRSGNVPSLPVVTEPLEKMCMRPFRVMQINWKGEAILCCNDYHGEVICGDTNIDPIKDIWENSKILRTFRQKLLHKDRTNLKLCDACSFKGGSYLHFLPKYWSELL